MENQDYLLQQLNKIKTLLSPKEEKLHKDGYSIIYDSYWESEVNEDGKSVQNGFIQITIKLKGLENSLDYCYCICENVGGIHEKMYEIEQYYANLLLDIQSLENKGTRIFKRLYRKQMMDIRKNLYAYPMPFSWIMDWSIGKTIFLIFLIGIVVFMISYFVWF